MSKLLKILVTSAILLMFSASMAMAGELDQTNTSNDGYYITDLPCNDAIAQTFTVGKSGRIDKASLYVGREGVTKGGLVVSFYHVDQDTGKPNSSDPWGYDGWITSTIISFEQLPYGTNGWFDIPLTAPGNLSPIKVEAGEKYAVVFRRDNEPDTGGCSNSGGTVKFARSFQDTYPGGRSWYMNKGLLASGWGSVSTPSDETDIYFRTFVDPPPPPDTDGDGVIDADDQCPNTESGVQVDASGCPLPPPDTTVPTGTVLINNGATRTDTRLVTLSLSATDPEPGSGVTQMRFKNEGADAVWSDWKPYAETKNWYLSAGEGTKRVAVQYRDAAGNRSATAYDYIVFRRSR